MKLDNISLDFFSHVDRIMIKNDFEVDKHYVKRPKIGSQQIV